MRDYLPFLGLLAFFGIALYATRKTTEAITHAAPAISTGPITTTVNPSSGEVMAAVLQAVNAKPAASTGELVKHQNCKWVPDWTMGKTSGHWECI